MIVQTDPRRPCVVLVGPPGAGKSTIGRRLARELGVDLYDTDAGIEDESGRTIPEIFAADGEPEFRRIEEEVVRRAVLQHEGVVSLGGGAVLSAATRELLRERTVVYLEISIAEGLRRTGANSHRPLLAGDDPGAEYRRLMRERRPLYREVAGIRVRTDGRSPGRVVRAILTKLGMEPVEPPVPPPPADREGATRRSRSRRRRRRGRGRSKADADAAVVEPGARAAPADDASVPTGPESAGTGSASNTAAADTDSASADKSPAKRRSRRSRRGGRRRSRSTPASPGEIGTADGPAAPADLAAATPADDTAQAPAGRSGRTVQPGGSPDVPGDDSPTTDTTSAVPPAGARRTRGSRRGRRTGEGSDPTRTVSNSAAIQSTSNTPLEHARPAGPRRDGPGARPEHTAETLVAHAPGRRQRRTATRAAGPPITGPASASASAATGPPDPPSNAAARPDTTSTEHTNGATPDSNPTAAQRIPHAADPAGPTSPRAESEQQA